jgi:hypothetical protein
MGINLSMVRVDLNGDGQPDQLLKDARGALVVSYGQPDLGKPTTNGPAKMSQYCPPSQDQCLKIKDQIWHGGKQYLVDSLRWDEVRLDKSAVEKALNNDNLEAQTQALQALFASALMVVLEPVIDQRSGLLREAPNVDGTPDATPPETGQPQPITVSAAALGTPNS